jgi:undecaprenyl-diphosphatase
MLSTAQAAVLGAIQGLTELFPISSLGHSVLLPALLGWNIDQSGQYFLPFLVLTHLATALVLLGFFWQEWLLILGGMLRSLTRRSLVQENPYARLGWLLVVGSIPAGALGFLFQKRLTALFAAPHAVAAFLFLNGLLLFAAEFVRKRRAHSAHTNPAAADARLTWAQAIGIGCMQCLALLPGLSRTGSTLAGGLWSGLSHEEAARFSFLLATPVIFAAALLEVPKLAFAGTEAVLFPALVGALCAAAAAYASVRFLTRYFKTKTLLPFAWYCTLAGALLFFIL